MSDTPLTDEEFSVLKEMPMTTNKERFEKMADFSMKLERENMHLLVLATNAEFNASKAERELAEQVLCNGKGAEREADLLGKVERLERENARLLEALNFYADQQNYGPTPESVLETLFVNHKARPNPPGFFA